MDMIDVVSKLLPAAVPLVTAFGAMVSGPGRLRREILHNAEIVGKLPESAARDRMLTLLDRQVADMASGSRRRDWSMLVVAIIVAGALWYLTAWLLKEPDAIRVIGATVAALVALIFTYGVFESARLIPRDEKGSTIKRDDE